MMTIVSKLAGRWGAVCGLVAAGLFLAGCHGGSGARKFAETPGVAGAPVEGAQTSSPESHPESRAGTMIRVGDMLTIIFSDAPVPSPKYEEKVKEDGTIMLLENQSFQAAGKSLVELQKEIRERYVPRFFLSMTVSVSQQKDTQFYYVGGDVRSPGRQIYISRITVLKAIQSAGDFTDFANKKKVQLTRVDGTTVIINCVKARTNPKLDLEVFPGDSIRVPRKVF
jgi:protein involved in polysaccharide export with SLBB domain